MLRFSWILIVAVLCDCARDPRAPAATAEHRPLVTLPVADAGCYRLHATAPDSVLRLLAALHRWVMLDTTRPAPVGSPFPQGLPGCGTKKGGGSEHKKGIGGAMAGRIPSSFIRGRASASWSSATSLS